MANLTRADIDKLPQDARREVLRQIDADAQRAARATLQTAFGRKRSKYGAKPVVIDGIRFASQKEGRRYSELCLLQKAGEIRWFCRQARFTIEGGEYVCDFVICGNANSIVVEDVKGFRTPIYRRSKKQMNQRYGIEISEK